MNIVPWWLYIIIFYFVYDDIWFSAEESPIIHYSLVAILLVLTLLIAIGQGKIVQEGIRIMTDALKDRVAFLR